MACSFRERPTRPPGRQARPGGGLRRSALPGSGAQDETQTEQREAQLRFCQLSLWQMTKKATTYDVRQPCKKNGWFFCLP